MTDSKRSTGSASKRLRPVALLTVAAMIVVLLVLQRCNAPANPGSAPTATLQTQLDAVAGEAPSSTPGEERAATEAPTATPSSRARSTATRSPTRTRAAPTALPPTPDDDLETVRLQDLPAEALTTLRLIGEGGPFPYRQDGTVFQNREGLLPAQPSGYYREYTVVTPGSPDRGARRIVKGERGELYYTDDHYATFRRVIP